MSITSSNVTRRSVFVGAWLIVASLILVPLLVRARQHWDRRDPIRTSIRLNWNSDAPPTKAHLVRDTAKRHAVVAPTSDSAPSLDSTVRRDSTLDAFAPKPRLDPAPDTLRGPPATTVS